MADKKTVQAQKISVSWTPNEKAARAMLDAVPGLLEGTFTSGRLSLKFAIAAQWHDADHTMRVVKRIGQITDRLKAAGTLHSFNISAGAVPVAEAEVLPEPAEEDQADGPSGGESEGGVASADLLSDSPKPSTSRRRGAVQ